MELFKKIQDAWQNLNFNVICNDFKKFLKDGTITLKDVSAVNTMFSNGMTFKDIELKMTSYQRLYEDMSFLQDSYQSLVQEYEKKKIAIDKEIADRIRSVESLEKLTEKQIEEQKKEFLQKITDAEKEWAANINNLNEFLEINGIVNGFYPGATVWFEDENGKPTSSIVKKKKNELEYYMKNEKIVSKLTVLYTVDYHDKEISLNHDYVYGSIDELLNAIKEKLAKNEQNG